MMDLAQLAIDWNTTIVSEKGEPKVVFTGDGPQVMARQGVLFRPDGTRQGIIEAFRIWKMVTDKRKELHDDLRRLNRQKQYYEGLYRTRFIAQQLKIVNRGIGQITAQIRKYM